MLLKGKPIADEIYNKIYPTIKNHTLNICGYMSEIDTESYAKQIMKVAEKLDVKVLFNDDIDKYDSLIMSEYGLIAIPPKYIYDVDGISEVSLSRFYVHGMEMFAPATPKAVMKILKYYKLKEKFGNNIVVIGRSERVGRPLAHLLQLDNYTITLCHSYTNYIEKYLLDADIIVSCIGIPNFITKTWTKPQAIIDVGVNLVNGKLTGDICDKFDTDNITPVPGGVGPVTTACLFEKMALNIKIRRGKNVYPYTYPQ